MAETTYNVSFINLDMSMGWKCDAPSHLEEYVPIPNATAVFMATMPGTPLTIHQVCYVCNECQTIMRADLAGAGQ